MMFAIDLVRPVVCEAPLPATFEFIETLSSLIAVGSLPHDIAYRCYISLPLPPVSALALSTAVALRLWAACTTLDPNHFCCFFSEVAVCTKGSFFSTTILFILFSCASYVCQISKVCAFSRSFWYRWSRSSPIWEREFWWSMPSLYMKLPIFSLTFWLKTSLTEVGCFWAGALAFTLRFLLNKCSISLGFSSTLKVGLYYAIAFF